MSDINIPAFDGNKITRIQEFVSKIIDNMQIVRRTSQCVILFVYKTILSVYRVILFVYRTILRVYCVIQFGYNDTVSFV